MFLRKDFTVIGILYIICAVFALVNFYFNIIPTDLNSYLSYIIIAFSFYAVIRVLAVLPGLRFAPIVQLTTLLLLIRLTGLCVSIFCRYVTGFELYRLPFGSLDVFGFQILSIGILSFLSSREEAAADKTLRAYQFLPLLIIAVPFLINFFVNQIELPEFILAVIFSVLSSLTIIYILIVRQRADRWRGLSVKIMIAVFADLLLFIYYTPIAVYLPGNLNRLFIPVYMLLIANDAAGLERSELE